MDICVICNSSGGSLVILGDRNVHSYYPLNHSDGTIRDSFRGNMTPDSSRLYISGQLWSTVVNRGHRYKNAMDLICNVRLRDAYIYMVMYVLNVGRGRWVITMNE